MDSDEDTYFSSHNREENYNSQPHSKKILGNKVEDEELLQPQKKRFVVVKPTRTHRQHKTHNTTTTQQQPILQRHSNSRSNSRTNQRCNTSTKEERDTLVQLNLLYAIYAYSRIQMIDK